MKQDAIYKNLNENQKRAVDLVDGPVLILAGPGTGKTQLLSVRAANIMRKSNIRGENILILTYTNSAAKAVKERLADIIGFRGYEVMAETFHGFANSIILDSEEAVEYINMRIQMTDIERVKAIEYILDNFKGIEALKPFGYPYLYRGEISKRISELKNEAITPEGFEKLINKIGKDTPGIEEKHLLRLKELSFIYTKYEEIKRGTDKEIFDERGRYDYDDMILLAIETLNKEPTLKEAYRKKYRYIMVDEFQDTNGAQLKLLFELIGGSSPNICCVGDDDQSIYRFQGASTANFKILQKRFPGISVIKLKRNYRSSKEILSLTSKIIKQIPKKERLDEEKKLIPTIDHRNEMIEVMTFSTEDEEILYIIKKIKELKEIIQSSEDLKEEDRIAPYNNIAILLRKRVLILKLIDAFLKAGIPYTTDGKEDISRERRVRQLIDILRLANPTVEPRQKDIFLYRILTSDYLEIPHNDVLEFIDYVNSKKTHSSLLTELTGMSFEKTNSFYKASLAIARLLKDSDTRPIHDVLMQFIDDTDLYKFILKEYQDKRLLRIRDIRAMSSFINKIKNSSMSNPNLTVSEFLSELDLRERHDLPITGELITYTQDGVKIITAHASKGLEFHTVIIPFCLQDKSWPLKAITDKIPLPASVIKTKESVSSKSEKDLLNFFDETRLFYVAASRAKANLVFTSSPSENAITSSFFNNINIVPRESKESEEDVINEFFTKIEERDPFEHSEGVLKNMIKDLTLTPTKLNTYLRCKRKFLYNSVLLLPGRKKQSLIFGNCVHKALEEVYRKYKKEKAFPDFDYFKDIFSRGLRYEAIDKAIKTRCEEKLPLLEKWFIVAKDKAVIPLDLEKSKIIVLNGGIRFTGKFDKIEFEDESKKLIRVIDYKTGIPDKHIKKIEKISSVKDEDCDDYLRQLVAYKMLYERDTYERSDYKVSHGMLVFVEPAKDTVKMYNLIKGKYVDKKIRITEGMVCDLEELIKDVWNSINNLEFDKLPEKDKDICPSCDFCSICWE